MELKSSVMRLNHSRGVGYITFLNLESYKFVTHAFSTRIGGVSEAEFSTMNLGFGRGDTNENVTENYHRFCDAIGVSFDKLVASAQDHGTNIRCVTEKECGIGIFKEKDMTSVDGLLTNRPGVVLVTYYADCTPIFYLDPVKKVVGLAHAGWRGTVGGIAKKMVEKMTANYGCEPEHIVCAIGPAIGPCCYEVDEPVYEKFAAVDILSTPDIATKQENGKYKINLWQANKALLRSAGVHEENIAVSDVCTCCNKNLLFSHRATKGKRGNLAAMISLKEM